MRLFQWIDGAGRLVAPRNVVVVEDGAEITIVEEQLSETVDGASLHAGGTEVFVGQNAKLTYGQIQDWGRNVFHYGNIRALRHVCEMRAAGAADVPIRNVTTRIFLCMQRIEPTLFADYKMLEMPDGTFAVSTDWRKV